MNYKWVEFGIIDLESHDPMIFFPLFLSFVLPIIVKLHKLKILNKKKSKDYIQHFIEFIFNFLQHTLFRYLNCIFFILLK